MAKLPDADLVKIGLAALAMLHQRSEEFEEKPDEAN
jgi:hypothetical protein